MTELQLPDLGLLYEPENIAGRDAYNQKNYNWGKLNSAFSSISAWLEGVQEGYELRITNLIQGVTQPSEVVDARIDVLGNQFPTLKLHLDNIETNKLSGVDVSDVDVPMILQIKGLTTASKGLHMTGVQPVSGYISEDAGLVVTDVSRISLVKEG
ncbi:hypothetical protein KBX31_10540 [Liquorilactobacillus satsumensis]|uniref:hypothetical protein n=1 Tax=Lactobacillaceae TaxID=33958 RepID=UPI0021C43BE8|nr:hypothetical protein [Liquorilactobacillus satsumensis]MCP9313706.1 hypothetical protein [Liquorilactobacillus satsumensis]MCP9360847.1 hypothetical protein [Liquorilactobacillus satsumensis]